MKLHINDVLPGDNIYLFCRNSDYPTITFIEVKKKEYVGDDLYKFNNEVLYDYFDDELYDDIDEAIDRIRSLYPIREFDESTIYDYMPYILQCIDEGFKVYAIRRNPDNSKYIDTSIITEVRYDNKTSHWKIILESVKKGRKTCSNASSLGLKIFFSLANAQNRIKKEG